MPDFLFCCRTNVAIFMAYMSITHKNVVVFISFHILVRQFYCPLLEFFVIDPPAIK